MTIDVKPILYMDPGDYPLQDEAGRIYVTSTSFDGNTKPLYGESSISVLQHRIRELERITNPTGA